MMCSPHPRTPGAYKVASGDAPGHWPMFVTYSGCTMRAFAKLYDYILHQLGPHKHLRRRHRAMVSNPGSITQTHSMCYQGFIIIIIIKASLVRLDRGLDQCKDSAVWDRVNVNTC